LFGARLFRFIFLCQLFYRPAALALEKTKASFSPVTRQEAVFQLERTLNDFHAIFFCHIHPLPLLLPTVLNIIPAGDVRSLLAISTFIIGVRGLRAHKNGV
jgi:hypothetical protein